MHARISAYLFITRLIDRDYVYTVDIGAASEHVSHYITWVWVNISNNNKDHTVRHWIPLFHTNINFKDFNLSWKMNFLLARCKSVFTKD